MRALPLVSLYYERLAPPVRKPNYAPTAVSATLGVSEVPHTRKLDIP
jgi:hypothetical protein